MTFNAETIMSTKTLRLRVIRPVYETLIVKEGLPDYMADKRINSSSDVYHLFSFLANETKEHFIAIHLDNKNKILCIDRVSTGSLTASIVHPREVMKSVMLSSAAALVLLHNHPSGDPTPSREDLDLTKRLKECCELMGVRCLDHVIVGSGSHVSLADRGII